MKRSEQICKEYAGRDVIIERIHDYWVVVDATTMRVIAETLSVSIKHAKPLGSLIRGVVTVVPRFPNGFDCANIVKHDDYYAWESRDGRNGKTWLGSDIVAINGCRINAGSCNLIDVYESSNHAS